MDEIVKGVCRRDSYSADGERRVSPQHDGREKRGHSDRLECNVRDPPLHSGAHAPPGRLDGLVFRWGVEFRTIILATAGGLTAQSGQTLRFGTDTCPC